MLATDSGEREYVPGVTPDVYGKQIADFRARRAVQWNHWEWRRYLEAESCDSYSVETLRVGVSVSKDGSSEKSRIFCKVS